MSAATIDRRGPHAALADAVMDSIEGGRAACAAIEVVRQGCASPDSLLDAMQATAGSEARLRGFMRALQKALERAA
jgi:hypothetical protein